MERVYIHMEQNFATEEEIPLACDGRKCEMSDFGCRFFAPLWFAH